MAPQKKSPPWQEMRQTLSAKNKTELLNLIRDLYALTPENQDLVRTHARAPKALARRKVMVKDIGSGKTPAVVPRIRRLAQIAADLRKGDHFEVTRLITLKSLCADA
jgi:hypothetical protein